MSYGLSLTTVPKDLYYVERALVERQAAEIERLRHENDEMRRTYGSHPLFKEKEAEIERLRAALKPFADPKLLDDDDAGMKDDVKFLSWSDLTIGDIRRAQVIINQQLRNDPK